MHCVLVDGNCKTLQEFRLTFLFAIQRYFDLGIMKLNCKRGLNVSARHSDSEMCKTFYFRYHNDNKQYK